MTKNDAVEEFESPHGWIKVQDARLMYDPEACENAPIQGIMMGTMQMNPPKNSENQQPWTALVIKLTKSCPALNNKKEVEVAGEGEEILVSGYDLNSLYAAANHEKYAFEVLLRPSGVLRLGGGRKMRQFTKMVNPKPKDRALEGLRFFGRSLSERSPVAMIGSGDSSKDSEIPF